MSTEIFDMPEGWHGFLFRGRDGELYFATFDYHAASLLSWKVSELHHVETGRVVYWESAA